jgi:glycosyltransferase involved in cell wall biosynthesis
VNGPKIVGFWDEAAVFKTGGHARAVLWFARQVDKWLRKRADLCVTSTREHQRYWGERYSKPILYMPHACYLTDENDGENPFIEPTLVYMGSMNDAEWDHDLFFEALRILKEKEGLVPALYIMGTGRLIPKWQTFCNKYGVRVTFGGFQTGTKRFQHLRHARALLFPIRDTLYHKTRCPSKTLAYAQARRPIITCRVGEIPEMLGDQAFYVNSTPEAFAQGIKEVLSNVQFEKDIIYPIHEHTWNNRAQNLLSNLS